MRRVRKIAAIGAAAAMLIALPAAAESGAERALRIGAGNALAGKEKARAHQCFECHGEDGASTSSGYPNLAGQYSGYLLKQLHNFRSGERKSPFMNIVAGKVNEADLADIAAYFASLDKVKSEAVPASAAARKLYANGDQSRNIVACASCHGEAGAGNVADGASFPAIGGQQMFYLREQLLNWRLGTRSNSPGRIMNKVSDALSEAEIDALSAYISGM